MRDERIDILRFIGLSLIILAHVDPPGWLFQLRNFDVPLMVLLSGMSYGLVAKKVKYWTYMWKRVKRLVLPVWIFLSLYFGFNWIFRFSPEECDWEVMLTSFTFLFGIGYVWIIRVFLLMALICPLLKNYCSGISSNASFLAKLGICFVCYEFFLVFTRPDTVLGVDHPTLSQVSAWSLLSMIFHYAIGYSLVLAFGFRLKDLSCKAVSLCFSVSFFVFIIGLAYLKIDTGEFVSTNYYKYPPSIYYFSYALACCCAVWLSMPWLFPLLTSSHRVFGTISFIAQNSIWMYLWHIPFVKFAKFNFDGSFLFVYLIAYSGALLMTLGQVSIVKKCVIPLLRSERMRRNVLQVLSG